MYNMFLHPSLNQTSTHMGNIMSDKEKTPSILQQPLPKGWREVEKVHLPAELAKDWVHSYEEDTEYVSVFRPSDYKFPPARGRRGMELMESGVLIEKTPGPADRRKMTYGTWRIVNCSLELSVPGCSVQLIPIESAEPERLVLRNKTPIL